ncbi:PREDICTED: protein LOL1-like isoform X2 [Lupinus angustifolius]|uniref:protein LOL1-like isoform X2 n=1 Tax=Lupinus angustifolius TaxID=3871 RepID=UPI00092EFBBC|nr:PREDICTED: protein LOL1-like isoform X2 [Lupinus angustifolius]
MPVPLAPYPTPPPSAANGAQSQLVCSGCRNLLLYPVGATSVCCAVCNAVTAVPHPGTEMAQLVCGGCHILLMYTRGATSVKCSCCHTVNLALEANQVAHVNCGNCIMLLMYQYGATSVKCAVCNFVTSVGGEKAMAKTEEEKVIAHERAKARKAKAKMEMHEAKARHAEEKLKIKQYSLPSHEPPLVGSQQPLGAVAMPGNTHPSYPLGGNLTRNKHI